MKLGSLFSGSGGFELAGALHGIEPVWCSEIEPFAIQVEGLRFPRCKQLGSVTDIRGDAIEPVDIITFGSPCQDLSHAWTQEGIHKGERSSLFFEAIRIIKEMRHGTANQFPRFGVWENVPGAFGSNSGGDFEAVLNAFCSVCDDTVSIPRPAGGTWEPAGCILGNGFSLAWKVYDAQYWGVPQRRKRIYLVADFRTGRAGEILFKQQSLQRDPDAGKEAWRNAAAYVAGCPDGSDWPWWWNGVDDVTDDLGAVCVGNGQLHQMMMNPVMDTLDCMHDQKIVLYRNTETGTGRKYVLRRITHVEALRLQGLPDWWLDGAKTSNKAVQRMTGNAIAVPCATDVLGRIAEEIRNGRKLQEIM